MRLYYRIQSVSICGSRTDYLYITSIFYGQFKHIMRILSYILILTLLLSTYSQQFPQNTEAQPVATQVTVEDTAIITTDNFGSSDTNPSSTNTQAVPVSEHSTHTQDQVIHIEDQTGSTTDQVLHTNDQAVQGSNQHSQHAKDQVLRIKNDEGQISDQVIHVIDQATGSSQQGTDQVTHTNDEVVIDSSSQSQQGTAQTVTASEQQPQQPIATDTVVDAKISDANISENPRPNPTLTPQTPPPAPTTLLVQVGQATIGRGYEADKGYSFQQLAVREIKGKYLFFDFILAQQDQWQAANISIVAHDNPTNLLINCPYDGLDSCYVPKNKLKSDSILNIGIHCTGNCRYNFNTHWSDIEHLSPGDDLSFRFGEQKSQLYHVELQKLDDFKQIRIHLAPRVTRKQFDNVKIYGKFGAESAPTVDQYDFISTNLWEDGEGVFLTREKVKNKNFNILVVGQAETTYRLTCEKITELHHEIANGEHVYEYLDAQSTKHYHLSFNASHYEEYSFRFSILSGDVKASYYVDEAMLTKYQFDSFEYMKDSEYIFFPQQVTDLQRTGLYIKVQSAKRDATYTLKFTPRRKAEPVELNEHVYGFIMMQETKFAYFNFRRWAIQSEEKKLKFTVSCIKIVGKVTLQFRVCQANLQDCTDENLYEVSSTIIPAPSHHNVSQKQIYSLQIDDKFLKQTNQVEKQALVIVRLIGTIDNTTNVDYNLVALEFLNKDKVMYLREGRPFQQKVLEEQLIVYKYVNSDPNVKEIRVHFNQIAGQIRYEGYIKSNNDMSNMLTVPPVAGTIRFTQNLTLPIFIAANALTRAIYSVSMQIIHKSQQNDNANLIAISEDLTYTVKIPPNSYTLFNIIPIYYEFFFKYSASQSVVACIVNSTTNQCIDQNGTFLQLPKISFKGVLTYLKTGRTHRVKIINPFSDLTAEVTVLFHSRKFQHCDYKKLGHVYSGIVKDKDCFSFLLQDNNPHPVNIYVSKREYASLSYSITLCGNVLKKVNDKKVITITQDVIYQMCHLSIEGHQISIIWSVSTPAADKTDTRVKVDFLAQYQTKVALLPEGVSYLCTEKAKEGQLRKFAFDFLNKRLTKVILLPIRGKFVVYAKIINAADRQTENISHINYQYKSSILLDYSQTPLIVVPENDIQNAGFADCALLISVYNLDEVDREVQFEIQVVQKFYSLNDNAVVNGYLEQNSLAYYNYHVRQEENTTLIFLLSDHNEHCANMYLGLAENVGPTVYIVKTIGTNQLIFQHVAGQEAKYYLAVESTNICDYSISAFTVDSSIHRLERGKQNLVRLYKKEVKYFTFENNSPEPFKILSLSKYGDVQLYLNKSDLEINRKNFRFDELHIKDFEVVSQQLNTLAIDTKNSEYCQNCIYFLGVEALRNTEATLYLTYPQTIVPLTTNKFFSDYITKKGQSTLASYNKIEKTKLEISVHSGEVEINAIYKQKKFTQTFSTQQSLQTMVIDVTAGQKPADKIWIDASPDTLQLPNTTTTITQSQQRIPINFVVTAKSDKTSYTLILSRISQKGSISGEAVYQHIRAGQSNHVTITSSTPLCLEGYFRDMEEQIFIATNTESKTLFNQVIIEQKLDGKIVPITKSLYKNILAIKLTPNNETFITAPYQLCLQIPNSPINQQPKDNLKKEGKQGKEAEESEESDERVLKAVVSQTNSINYLPSDVHTLVRGSNTYIVHSEGEFLLDLFECQGEAKIKYATSLKQLNNSKARSLNYMGMNDQRHAVKITEKETTFIQVDSPYSILSWIPIDYETDQGTGYMAYAKGDIKYESNFRSITILFQSLQKVKESTSKIQAIEYTLYLADDADKLEFSTHCEPGHVQGVHNITYTDKDLKARLQQKGKGSSDYLQFPLQKSFLLKQYGHIENIYFNIIAKLTLSPTTNQSKFAPPSGDDHEHYRFIYSRQQIPLETYQPSRLESMPYAYLISAIILLGLVVLMVAYVFIVKIVPIIGRLKTSNLVEEQDGAAREDEHKDDLEVPASSDRNRRQPDTAIETQEGIAK